MNTLRTTIRDARGDSSDYILVATWVMCAVGIVALLGGFFWFWLIIPLAVCCAGVGVYGFVNKRIIMPKGFVQIMAVMLFFLFGVMLLRGFYTGDGPAYWLPFARSMVENHRIIPFIQTQDAATGREPLLPIFLSIGIFFSQSEWAYGWVPLLFTLGTLLYIVRWLRDSDIEPVYQRWAVAIFLSAPLIAFWSWNILEEAPVLFAFTAFFFYADRYRKSLSDIDFIFLTTALGIALLTRYIALVLLLPYGLLWLQSQKKVHKLLFFGIACLPFLMWITKNCLVYHSPFFPLFSSLFGGPYAAYQAHSHFLGSLSMSLVDKIYFVIRQLAFELPIVCIGFWALIREKRYAYAAVVAIILLALTSLFFTQTSATRYFYPFAGLLVVYGFRYLVSEKNQNTLLFFLLILCASLLSVDVTQSSSHFIGSIEHLFHVAVPLLNFISRYAWIFALCIPAVMLVVKMPVDRIRSSIFVLLALHIVHLRFIENKSWIATWPWIILCMILIMALASKKLSVVVSRTMTALVLIAILTDTWGLAIVYAMQNHDLSFNSVSRIYSAQDIIGREIDRREKGAKDFYLLTEAPGYYAWDLHYHVVTFRSFNFNYITKLHLENAHSAAEVRDALQTGTIKYLIYEGDENVPAYEQFDTGYINAHNTIYQVARDNPAIFPSVFNVTDPENGIQAVVYQVYE